MGAGRMSNYFWVLILAAGSLLLGAGWLSNGRWALISASWERIEKNGSWANGRMGFECFRVGARRWENRERIRAGGLGAESSSNGGGNWVLTLVAQAGSQSDGSMGVARSGFPGGGDNLW